jgi:pyruvate dehydrogenase E2 component (dihydrolipoamide acetyltransferase)
MADTREFPLPDLGEGLTEAEIVQWLVKEGDTVDLNQPFVEVETEKALVEIPSPFAGTVEKLHGDVGEKVQVGSPLITVRTGEGAPEATPRGADKAQQQKPAQESKRTEVLVGYGPEEGASKRRKDRKIGKRDLTEEVAAAPAEEEQVADARGSIPTEVEPAGGKALATPPVRKLARDLGVDIDGIQGSGPDGRVTREDVTAASQGASRKEPARAAAPEAAPREEAEVVQLPQRPRVAAVADEEERIPVRAIRRSIAEKMARSAFTIPHVTEWLEVDATEFMRLREQLKNAPEAEGLSISPLPLVVKALLAALRKFPMVNSSWQDGDNGAEIAVKHVYHVGIATDTERGLLVPVVKNADQLNIFELSGEIKRLTTVARDGKIGPSDLTGSTITVTSIGSFGMESGTPIINYPECAILAPGVIRKKPWVVDGEIVVRDIMTLGMSFDHRIIDGAEAGRFLRYLGDLIENPARLFGVL